MGAQLTAAAQARNVTPGPWVAAAPQREIGGKIRLTLTAENGKTRLEELYHAQPLRVLFPLPSRGDIFQAAIACVSGGMVGGDRLETRIELKRGARALVIGQAAEKIYRSLGPDCVIENDLAVGPDAWLEFLPQETILFDQARLRRRASVTLARGARFLGGDIVVFGRKARGEILARGLLHDGWEFRDGAGRLTWKDALHLDGDLQKSLSSPAAFDGAAAFGTLIYAGADAPTHLAAMREIAETLEGMRAGVTQFRDLLIARLIARDALALRKGFSLLWSSLRARAGGLPPQLPRLWAI